MPRTVAHADTYLVDIAAMLPAIPVVLLPALAKDVFGHPELLGLRYSAETVGAVAATAARSGRPSSPTRGRSGRRSSAAGSAAWPG